MTSHHVAETIASHVEITNRSCSSTAANGIRAPVETFQSASVSSAYTAEMAIVPTSRLMVMNRQDIRSLDRLATEEYGIPGIALMENAATGAAVIALDMLDGAGDVLIVCGSGNNGGDGWAMARHLANAGCDVTIRSISLPKPDTDAAVNASICNNMGIPTTEDWPEADLLIDAVLGTGLDRPVEDDLLDVIKSINAASSPVLSLDIPSGLDADSGTPLGDAVVADVTATFAAWKQGFLNLESMRWTGTIHTIDIGTPASLHNRLGKPLRNPARHGSEH